VNPDLAQITPPKATTQGNIVFVMPDGNIALTDPAGRKTVNVTTDGFIDREKQELRVYQFPTFSNDGKQLAFVSVSTSAAALGVTQTLHVAQAAENAKRVDLYTTSADNIPYIDWSPDNETVAFLTIGGGNGEIRTVNKNGGEVSVLDTGSSVYWHWRNDSSAMVAHLGGGDAHISVIDDIAENGRKNKLTRIESLPGRFQSPHFSPDGKFMLFVQSVAREVDDLMLADASGNLICTVTRMEAGAFFAWSPNGTQIAYLDTVAPLQQPGPLTILDLKTGKRTTVGRNAMMFFWSPDGTKLALYSLTNEGEAPKLGSSVPRQAAPALQNSTTALRIEVIDAKTGRAIRVADTLPTQDFMQFFQFFDQYSRAVTPWSPDSNNLVFITVDRDSEKVDIGVASLNKSKNGYALTRIGTGSVAFWSPQ
jgi:Tol biopolymer transport system component